MKSILCFLILLALPAAALPVDPSEYAKWQGDLLNKIQEESQKNPDESIPKLSEWILNLSLSHHMEKDGRPVFRKALTTVLSIPGHAEYQKKIIEDSLNTLASLPEDNRRSFLCQYRDIQSRVFRTLELLPSPETVRVLGDYLADERGGLDSKPGAPLPTEAELTCYQIENRERAARSLRNLIDDPLSEKSPAWDEYHEWQLWYNQIKAGTRPIRFKGDPKEYHLENTERTGDGSTAVRPSKRPPSQTGETSKADSPEPSRTPWIIAAIAALSTAIGWFFLKKKQAF